MKRILALILACILTLGLAACSAPVQSGTQDTAEAQTTTDAADTAATTETALSAWQRTFYIMPPDGRTML